MWRPFYAITVPDDLILKCIPKILLDTDTLCGGALCRHVGTINFRGHSTANRLQSRILHPPEDLSIGIPLTCRRKTSGQLVYFCTFRTRIYRPAYLMSNFDSASRIFQSPGMNVLLIVYSITLIAYLSPPHYVGKKRWLDL